MDTSEQLALQRKLRDGLCKPQAWPWPVDKVEFLETHISTVFLAGEYACKIKKPLDLGFLDFSSLARRHHFCEEEIRLNRRLAPDHYLRVIAIGGSPDDPLIDASDDEPLEYAVLMRRFPQHCLMDSLAAAGELPLEAMDSLAEEIATFHRCISATPPDPELRSLEAIAGPMRDNFELVASRSGPEQAPAIDRLRGWTEQELEACRERLEARQAAGCIRECHGDLHLGNVAWLDGHALVFDGIEFDSALRWIDTCNDLAFLLMDVDFRLPPRYRNRLLDRYLERSGDFEMLPLLRLYCCYRAMVRAKIHCLRAGQFDADADAAAAAGSKAAAYTRHAASYCEPPGAQLVITCGLSGSGKSTLAAQAVEQEGFLRLRSDVERKRLFGLRPEDDASAAPGEGIYSGIASRQTYQRLLEVAELLLETGWPVIIDAAFLEKRQRDNFRELAGRHGVPFRILYSRASEDTLRHRLAQRQAAGGDASDASVAVLQQQLESAELPGDSERDWLDERNTESEPA